eukprot:m.136133 g.136133  ORF g.136133 m.136133 type:complete len:972 (-) comp13991_c0_seq3:536-3451(-)
MATNTQTTNNTCFLLQLPDELLEQIAFYLVGDVRSLTALTNTCRRLRHVVDTDFVWSRAYALLVNTHHLLAPLASGPFAVDTHLSLKQQSIRAYCFAVASSCSLCLEHTTDGAIPEWELKLCHVCRTTHMVSKAEASERFGVTSTVLTPHLPHLQHHAGTTSSYYLVDQIRAVALEHYGSEEALTAHLHKRDHKRLARSTRKQKEAEQRKASLDLLLQRYGTSLDHVTKVQAVQAAAATQRRPPSLLTLAVTEANAYILSKSNRYHGLNLLTAKDVPRAPADICTCLLRGLVAYQRHVALVHAFRHAHVLPQWWLSKSNQFASIATALYPEFVNFELVADLEVSAAAFAAVAADPNSTTVAANALVANIEHAEAIRQHALAIVDNAVVALCRGDNSLLRTAMASPQYVALQAQRIVMDPHTTAYLIVAPAAMVQSTEPALQDTRAMMLADILASNGSQSPPTRQEIEFYRQWGRPQTHCLTPLIGFLEGTAVCTPEDVAQWVQYESTPQRERVRLLLAECTARGIDLTSTLAQDNGDVVKMQLSRYLCWLPDGTCPYNRAQQATEEVQAALEHTMDTNTDSDSGDISTTSAEQDAEAKVMDHSTDGEESVSFDRVASVPAPPTTDTTTGDSEHCCLFCRSDAPSLFAQAVQQWARLKACLKEEPGLMSFDALQCTSSRALYNVVLALPFRLFPKHDLSTVLGVTCFKFRGFFNINFGVRNCTVPQHLLGAVNAITHVFQATPTQLQHVVSLMVDTVHTIETEYAARMGVVNDLVREHHVQLRRTWAVADGAGSLSITRSSPRACVSAHVQVLSHFVHQQDTTSRDEVVSAVLALKAQQRLKQKRKSAIRGVCGAPRSKQLPNSVRHLAQVYEETGEECVLKQVDSQVKAFTQLREKQQRIVDVQRNLLHKLEESSAWRKLNPNARKFCLEGSRQYRRFRANPTTIVPDLPSMINDVYERVDMVSACTAQRV